jgi:hypothetical protein
MKHYLLFAFSIPQKPIGSSSVTEVHISSAFDEKKMIFHLLNKNEDYLTVNFCISSKMEVGLLTLTKVKGYLTVNFC